MEFKLILLNDTNKTINFDRFDSTNKVVIKTNKKIISPKDSFEITIIILRKDNVKGLLVFNEFVIIILDYLQIHTGSSIFTVPINDKNYMSQVITLTRNLPSPNNLMYNSCYLKVINK